MGRRRSTYAEVHLPPPPTKMEVMQALEALYQAGGAGGGQGSTAAAVASYLGVAPARRGGRGAVKGSWSGYMSPALRVAPALRGLIKDGLVEDWWDKKYPQYSRSSVHLYLLTTAGRDAVAAVDATRA